MANHVLPDSEILSRLRALGYFGLARWSELPHGSSGFLEEAITRFQKFHGLDVDGLVGPHTAKALYRPRCALPDFEMREDARQCKWPMLDVTFMTTPGIQFPGADPNKVLLAYDIAVRQWADVCSIVPSRVTAENQANILAQSGAGKADGLDNRGGTLAWSELPCGATRNTQVAQMFDEAERWYYEMIIAVVCHEFGHALGLQHDEKGQLMAPYFDQDILKPQPGDIAKIRALYGNRSTPAPTPGPTPTPSPTGTPDVSGVITVNGFPFVLVPRT